MFSSRSICAQDYSKTVNVVGTGTYNTGDTHTPVVCRVVLSKLPLYARKDGLQFRFRFITAWSPGG